MASAGLPTLLRSEASCKVQGPAATIGRGPGHEDLASKVLTPGPQGYAAPQRSASQGPRATIGAGPGHVDLASKEGTPGPGDYSTEERKKIPGGSYFSSTRRNSSSGPAHERRNFRFCDRNDDGVLDLNEVRSLLQRGDESINDLEVKALFDALDTSKDGRIQFEELVDFLHVGGAKCSAWRARLRDAFDLSCPGPCDYAAQDRAWSKHKQQPKAVIGQGPGHDDYHRDAKTPGPASYAVNHRSIAPHTPAATIGNGPGHRDLSKEDPVPGPLDYCIEKSSSLRLASTCRGGWGQQPGHVDVFGPVAASPGPARYSFDYTQQSSHRKASAATFGRARPRSAVRNRTPGPAAYNTTTQERIRGGVCFGGPERFRLPPVSPCR